MSNTMDTSDAPRTLWFIRVGDEPSPADIIGGTTLEMARATAVREDVPAHPKYGHLDRIYPLDLCPACQNYSACPAETDERCRACRATLDKFARATAAIQATVDRKGPVPAPARRPAGNVTRCVVFTIGLQEGTAGPALHWTRADDLVGEVVAAVEGAGGTIDATVRGDSSSPWGKEPAVWLSASWSLPGWALEHFADDIVNGTSSLGRGVARIAGKYGQQAIGVIVDGHYVEIPTGIDAHPDDMDDVPDCPGCGDYHPGYTCEGDDV